SGIFNIYRATLAGRTVDGTSQPITNVVGGAFMPSVDPVGGKLSFSRYEWDGYKIAQLDAPEPLSIEALAGYAAPEVLRKPGEGVEESFEWERLNAYDDTD